MPQVAQRVALVTGCGGPSGIGFASARVLAESGMAVAISSTTERIADRVTELVAEGHEAFGAPADLTSAAEAAGLVDAAVARLGPIDVLVNAAGLHSVGRRLVSALVVDTDPADWARAIDTNLTTVFNTSRAVVPGMVERGYGRIVNISSVTGPHVAMPELSSYAAAKAGVDAFTRTLALETAAHGVTVNSVAPGFIVTDSFPEVITEWGRGAPIGRAGRPEEIAALVAFLASEAASYITGQSIIVDGANSLPELRTVPEGD
jgi:3-oxoacyl-[acyl-carrier protein] reductase